MSYKSDIEIAREAKKQPIQEIGAKIGIVMSIFCLMATTKPRYPSCSSSRFKRQKTAS